ncbi:unnamed protein product [Chrysodeixis includens]|uniref:Uncharacterized protein n=1 Tax=Chrysodeixis includens TaxID=689277 RepID=A0A9P0FU62_CHRIL|nr:unnamed protein product [Chrysodeixis includens]
MKSFAFAFVIVQAVLIQTAFSQCIRGSSPVAYSSIPAVAQPSVAASLADTLSLLTVSSLLAESLPLNPNVIATVPVAVAPAYAPAYTTSYAPAYSYGGCGGGCGCGCGGYNGYSYIF